MNVEDAPWRADKRGYGTDGVNERRISNIQYRMSNDEVTDGELPFSAGLLTSSPQRPTVHRISNVESAVAEMSNDEGGGGRWAQPTYAPLGEWRKRPACLSPTHSQDGCANGTQNVEYRTPNVE